MNFPKVRITDLHAYTVDHDDAFRADMTRRFGEHWRTEIPFVRLRLLAKRWNFWKIYGIGELKGDLMKKKPTGFTAGYANAADQLVARIEALVPTHPEILTMENPFDLFKVKGFDCTDLDPSLAQASWALRHVQGKYMDHDILKKLVTRRDE